MGSYLLRFMNWFIPEEFMSDTLEYGRSKVIVGIGFLVGFIIMLQSLRSFFIQVNLTVGFLVVVFSLAIMSAPFVLKYTKSKLLGGNVIMICIYCLATLIVLKRGGITCSIASYYSLIPIVAFITLSRRAGYVWGVFCLVALIGVFSLPRLGIEMPEQTMTADQLETYAAVTYSVLVAFAMILGGIFENISTSNLNRFSMAQKESHKVSDQLQFLFEDVNLVMGAVSKSDLSKRISIQAEGNLEDMIISVNEAIELLSGTIQQVSNASFSIHKGAEDLSETAVTLSEGTSTQAATLEEISASMNDIEELSKRNNEGANKSKKLIEVTLDSVKKGNEQMTEMVETMNQIASTGQNVTKVVKTIDEIAFQTNLLALNAAVEAARAGKYGKGFSVVAEEVRNLAARSAVAAKDTTELIDSTMNKINKGVEKVNVTAEHLNDIMGSVDKVIGFVNQIAAGSDEQRAGIEEITKSMGLVNNIVLQNSAVSEETASASTALKSQSQQLQQTMASFRLNADSTFQKPLLNY